MAEAATPTTTASPATTSCSRREGIQRSNGMAGFDWAIHKGDTVAANSDLGIPIFDTQEAFILRDRFDLVEGLSGWKHNDVLTGRVVAVNTRAEATGTAAIPGPDSPLESYSNDLLEKNVALINGLAGSWRTAPVSRWWTPRTGRSSTRTATRKGRAGHRGCLGHPARRRRQRHHQGIRRQRRHRRRQVAQRPHPDRRRTASPTPPTG